MSTTDRADIYRRVAMLCVGTEEYGLGAIQRIYAARCAGMGVVCFQDGPLWQWLTERNIRRFMIEGLRPFVAPGSSAKALARGPGVLLNTRATAARVRELAAREGFEILHTHWLPHQLVSGFARSKRLKTVWQINNNTDRRRLRGMGVRINHAMARWGCDLLLPASDFIKANWDGCGVPAVTIRNGADPQPDDGRGWPDESLPPHPLRCVAAGRLDASKGHHVAVDAVLLARGAGLDVRLDVFGGPTEGAYYDDLLKRVSHAGAVAQAPDGPAIRFLGFRNDLRIQHRNYHVALQCRIDPEPCSVWVCETLVDGMACIASATGGTPELVENGVTGFLYPPGDASALASHLKTLAGDPVRVLSMRRAARARGLAQFTLDRLVQQSFEAYCRMLRP